MYVAVVWMICDSASCLRRNKTGRATTLHTKWRDGSVIGQDVDLYDTTTQKLLQEQPSWVPESCRRAFQRGLLIPPEDLSPAASMYLRHFPN